MNTYMYQAALYCEDCGLEIANSLGFTEEDIADRDDLDSEECPKGPYSDGGGEADCPQHCDKCGAFLENPLTCDGFEYVCEANRPEWNEFYGVTESDRQQAKEERA